MGEKSEEEKKGHVAPCREEQAEPGQGRQGHPMGRCLHPADLGPGHSPHMRTFALLLAFAVLS